MRRKIDEIFPVKARIDDISESETVELHAQSRELLSELNEIRSLAWKRVSKLRHAKYSDIDRGRGKLQRAKSKLKKTEEERNLLFFKESVASATPDHIFAQRRYDELNGTGPIRDDKS